MKISAAIQNKHHTHQVTVQTDGVSQQLQISPKATGYGSSVNGGELLLLSLATCFCNDIYREAKKRNISITGVEVTCTGEFGSEGEPGSNFRYSATITSDASRDVIEDLIAQTDKVAEIHNTLRQGLAITLVQ